jgi:hypothetical protein
VGALLDQLLDEIGRHSDELSARDHSTAVGQAAQQRLHVPDYHWIGAVDEPFEAAPRGCSFELGSPA